MEPMDIRAPDRKKGFLSGAFFFLSLSNLLHEAAHSGSRLVLLLASGVGVGAQGETGVEVAEHGGDSLYVHAVLQGRGSEGVTEIMKSEVLQPGVLENLLVEIHHRVRVVHLSGEGRGEHVGAVRVLGVLLDQQVYCCLRDGRRPHRLE